MSHVTGAGGLTFYQNFSTLALTAWKWRFVEDMVEKDHSLNQLINYIGVYTTAPATRGLLIKERGQSCTLILNSKVMPLV